MTDSRVFLPEDETRAAVAVRFMRRRQGDVWASWPGDSHVAFVLTMIFGLGQNPGTPEFDAARRALTIAKHDKMMYRRAAEILAAVALVDGHPAVEMHVPLNHGMS